MDSLTTSSLPAQSIRVCHIASGDLWAGAEVQIATLLRSLANCPSLEIKALILNDGRLAEELRAAGVDVQVLPESKLSFLQILSRSRQHLKHFSAQIIHSHRYKENLLSALLARLCGIPGVVRTQHGLPEMAGAQTPKQRVLQSIDTAVAKIATDKVISVSSELSLRLQRNMQPGKLVTIVNGLDTARVESSLTPEQAKQKLGFRSNTIVIGSAGRLEPVKRFDLFLEVANRLNRSLPDAQYVIIGAGRQMNTLKNRAAELGLSGCVSFLGHRQDVYDVIRALDVFLMCSDHEGMPMVLLEALQLRTPVIARAVGGIPEVIVDGVNGTLLKDSNIEAIAQECMAVLAIEKSRLSAMTQAGARTIVDRFSSQETASRVHELYRSLLSDKNLGKNGTGS